MDAILSPLGDLLARARNSFAAYIFSWILMMAAAVAFVTILNGNAFAVSAAIPGDGMVIIPWGDWLRGLLEPAGALVIAMVMWALRRLPASVYLYLQMMRAEQLITRAVDFALAATAGAVAGKELNLPVTAGVLENAAEYAVKHAPDLVRTIGGADRLKEKVLARLHTSENVSVGELRTIGAL